MQMKKSKEKPNCCACKLGICTKAVKWRIVCVGCMTAFPFESRKWRRPSEERKGQRKQQQHNKREKSGTTFVECNLYCLLWSLIWLHFTHFGIWLAGNKSNIQKEREQRIKKTPESWRTKKKMRRWNRRRNFLHSMKENCDTHTQSKWNYSHYIHCGDDDHDDREWARMRRMRKIAVPVIRIKLFQTYAKVVHIRVGWF